MQALVDKCTDITELSYPTHVYKTFDENQRQRVFQNRQGRPKNANSVSPPSSVALSELSSVVSTWQDTIATQVRMLAENERYCQDIPRDSASVDANRKINCAGGAPRRNERARGSDRE